MNRERLSNIFKNDDRARMILNRELDTFEREFKKANTKTKAFLLGALSGSVIIYLGVINGIL